MTQAQWLLSLHVSGAFLLVGGSVVAAVLRILALRSQRPSEIALFLGLVRIALAATGLGLLLTLVLGLWLVHDDGYSFGKGWIVASIVLWVLGNAFGVVGGQREQPARKLATQLAAAGDAPVAELRARVRDPLAMGFTAASSLAVLATLALMIWKPGS